MDHLRLLAKAGCALLLACAMPFATAHAQIAQLQAFQQLEPDEIEVFPTPDELIPVSFGTDVAIEGNRALISMPQADRGAGRIAIFRRDASGAWLRTGHLQFASVPNGVSKVELRNGIAVVASDDTVYVARPAARGAWRAVRQFRVDAGTSILDLSYDGETAVVGTSSGIHVFTINQQTSLHRQKISSPTGSAMDEFGSSVAVFRDALVVGAPGFNDGQGAAYVYRLRTKRWVRTQTLLAADGESADRFGSALAVRYGLIVVGAPSADPEYAGEFDELIRLGAAFVFAPRAGRWTQTQKVSPLDAAVESFLNFGTRIEINGGRVVIGSPGFPGLTFDTGSLYVYARQGSTLSTLAFQATESNALGYAFGVWGNTVIAGVVEPTFFTGRALVYDMGAAPPEPGGVD